VGKARLILIQWRKMNKKLKQFVRFLPPLLWMVFIFYLSSRQKLAVSPNYWFSFFVFKSLHIIEYGTLFFLWFLALAEAERSLGGRKKRIRLAIYISFLYAISDELHQTLVPTREGRGRDVFIDLLGIILFWKIFLRKFEQIIKNNRWLGKIIFLNE